MLDENKRMQQRIAELQTANVGLTHKTECLQKDAEHAARRHDEQVRSCMCNMRGRNIGRASRQTQEILQRAASADAQHGASPDPKYLAVCEPLQE